MSRKGHTSSEEGSALACTENRTSEFLHCDEISEILFITTVLHCDLAPLHNIGHSKAETVKNGDVIDVPGQLCCMDESPAVITIPVIRTRLCD